VYFCVPMTPATAGYRVIEHVLATRQQRDVTQVGSCMMSVISPSPDGRWLATVSRGETARSSQVVLIAPTSGEKRTLMSVDSPQSLSPGLGWTRDSQAVIVRRTPAETASDNTHGQLADLLAIPVDGAQPRKLDVNVDLSGPLTTFRVHPDGQRMAFFTVVPQATEVWIVENFLSVLGPKRASSTR
jgi:hypothetical protein